MSNAEHTPGPWTWERERLYDYGYSVLWNADTRQEVIATGGRNEADEPITWMGEEMSPADAALIAASPDLLASLEEVTAELAEFADIIVNGETDARMVGMVERARAAISRARGQS